MIVVVGLAFEARIAATSGLQVICAGTGGNLAPSLRQAAAIGCRGLISFGIAGGLRPGLRPGTCIVASAIVVDKNHFATDARWSRQLLQAMPGALPGVLAGAHVPVARAADKHALHRETAADAVDTESHIVARAAAEHGLPMAAVRVVCDPAARNLPEFVIRSIRADGSTDVRAVLRSLLREPRHISTVARVAIDARAAHATLLRCSRALAPEPATVSETALPEGPSEPLPSRLKTAG